MIDWQEILRRSRHGNPDASRVVRRSSGMPVRSANSIQISGTRTPSRSRQTICTENSLICGSIGVNIQFNPELYQFVAAGPAAAGRRQAKIGATLRTSAGVAIEKRLFYRLARRTRCTAQYAYPDPPALFSSAA